MPTQPVDGAPFSQDLPTLADMRAYARSDIQAVMNAMDHGDWDLARSLLALAASMLEPIS